ncbi:MAG: hypothetical protein LBH07_06070 [Treponema sp.]|jgi:hypothetical protein|nr:hypothetical protein [Treponema sp.]
MWWNPLNFKEAVWYYWHLAGAEVFICRTGIFWQAFCRTIPWKQRENFCTGPVEKAPDLFAELQKTALDCKTASLCPCLPEKPFLLNLKGQKLFPGTEMTLDLEFPPVLRLTAAEGNSEQNTIFSFILFELKETLYSPHTMDGTFCSSISASKLPGAMINCSMLIRNRTKTVMELDAIPFFADMLSIYEINGKLVSDTPVIDAIANGFRMSYMNIKRNHGTILVHGCKKGLSLGKQFFINRKGL